MSLSELQILLGLLFLAALVYLLVIIVFGQKRPSSPNSSTFSSPETECLRRFRWTFRCYAVQECNHKEAMLEIEKDLLQLKIRKFQTDKSSSTNGSILPLVAKSMNMSVSNVYALMDKHGIQRDSTVRL